MDDKRQYTVREIAEIIDDFAPVSTQEEWDNSGLIIGYEDSPVNRIMTCLDISEAVIVEAIKKKVDMIVSHHPLIFRGVDRISSKETIGKSIIEMISRGISLYSSHTPFDKAKGGNNDVLAKAMGLTSVKSMGDINICRIGKLKKPTPLFHVIESLAQSLEMSLRGIRTVGELDQLINIVGVCAGAGAEFIDKAYEAGCQLFVTGDVKYHDGKKAEALGLCLIDAGHFNTEKFFGKTMKDKLEKKLDDRIEIIISDTEEDPFGIL